MPRQYTKAEAKLLQIAHIAIVEALHAKFDQNALGFAQATQEISKLFDLAAKVSTIKGKMDDVPEEALRPESLQFQETEDRLLKSLLEVQTQDQLNDWYKRNASEYFSKELVAEIQVKRQEFRKR